MDNNSGNRDFEQRVEDNVNEQVDDRFNYQDEKFNYNQSNQSSAQNSAGRDFSSGANSSANSAETNKWIAVIAYFGILFFVPIVVDQNNEFYKFHANQAFVLFIAGIVVNIVGTIIPVLGWFIILPVGGIALLVFAIMGMLNAYNERMKELPIIGKFRIIN